MVRPRLVASVLLIGVFAGRAGVGGAASPAPTAATTYWQIPTVWSADTQVVFSTQEARRPTRFRTGAGAGARYEFRRLRWAGWGTRKAIGLGQARNCADDGSGCTPWKAFRLELLTPLNSACGDEGAVFFYTRYRGYGLVYDRRPGTIWHSDRVC